MQKALGQIENSHYDEELKGRRDLNESAAVWHRNFIKKRCNVMKKFIITDTRRNNHMKKIGFIGVGIMGKSMVRNLMKAGFELHIYARTRSKVEDVISEGAISTRRSQTV